MTPSGTPALTKPMKQSAASAEGRDNTQASRRDAADPFASSCQERARALRREEAAHDTHGKDHEGKQQQNFRGVVDEESDGLADRTGPG